MFGGFSSKNSLVSFAPPSIPPAPQTPSEWKASLFEIKRLYLDRQYKQCAARSTEIFKSATKSVRYIAGIQTRGVPDSHQQIHPIYKTYLCFYAAISYEFLGRAAHLYSRNKIPLLHSSLDFFAECGASLPEAIPLPRLPIVASPALSPYPSPSRSPTTVEPCSPVSSSPEGIEEMFVPGEMRPTSVIENLSRMIDISILTAHDDPFFSDNSTAPQTPFMRKLSQLAMESPKPAVKKPELMPPPPKPIRNTTDPIKKNPMIPSPLRIRKSSSDAPEDGPKRTDDNDSWNKAGARPRPPPLPLKIIPASKLNINSQQANATVNIYKANGMTIPSSLATSTMTSTERANEALKDITPARAAQVVRFNRGIDFLREQIKSNIAQVQQHIDHVEEIQRARRSRKMQRAVSFWSFSPVKSEEGSDEQQAQEPVMDQFGNILIKETKQQRIARLRREGWNTVGLRSPHSTWKGARYYQEFCNMVMNELYLNQ